MPKDMLTEQDWQDFLHQLQIWERRWIYKREMALHDRVAAGEIQLVDIIDEINKNGEEGVAMLAAVTATAKLPAPIPAEEVTPKNAGDLLVDIIDKHKD